MQYFRIHSTLFCSFDLQLSTTYTLTLKKKFLKQPAMDFHFLLVSKKKEKKDQVFQEIVVSDVQYLLSFCFPFIISDHITQLFIKGKKNYKKDKTTTEEHCTQVSERGGGDPT